MIVASRRNMLLGMAGGVAAALLAVVPTTEGAVDWSGTVAPAKPPESYVSGMWARVDDGEWKLFMRYSLEGRETYFINSIKVTEREFAIALRPAARVLVDSTEMHYAPDPQQLMERLLRAVELQPIESPQ